MRVLYICLFLYTREKCSSVIARAHGTTRWSKFTQPILKYILMVAIQHNSIGFLTYNITVTIQEPTQVTSCYHVLAPVRQLSSNCRSARMSFWQVQQVFIVEHYLASRSYSTCQSEFRDTFPDSSASNKSTVSRLVNRFRDTGTLHQIASNMRKRVKACVTERGGISNT
jgi:hypothetical protein